MKPLDNMQAVFVTTAFKRMWVLLEKLIGDHHGAYDASKLLTVNVTMQIDRVLFIPVSAHKLPLCG